MNVHYDVPPPNDLRPRQIIEAAASVFARRGFHAATVQDIAAEAGMSQGLLYRYFGSKGELVVALVEAYVEEVHAAVEGAATLAAAVDAVFRLPDAVGWSRGALYVEVVAEALRNERVAAVVRHADSRVGVALADRLRQAQRAGEVTADLDADAAADLVLALGDGLALRAARADEPEPPGLRRALDALLARFLHPANAPPPREPSA